MYSVYILQNILDLYMAAPSRIIVDRDELEKVRELRLLIGKGQKTRQGRVRSLRTSL